MLESLFNKAVSLTFEEHLQMAACRAKIQKERAKQKKKQKTKQNKTKKQKITKKSFFQYICKIFRKSNIF